MGTSRPAADPLQRPKKERPQWGRSFTLPDYAAAPGRAVRHAGIHDEGRRGAGGKQLVGQIQRVVQQRVQGGCLQDQGRQAGHVRMQRRYAGIGQLRGIADVLIPEPVQLFRGQAEAPVAKGFVRRRVAARRQHAVDHHARLDEGIAFVTQPLQGGQRQVAAGGLAADRQACCVQPQRGRLVAQPAQGAQHLFQRHGVAGFGRQRVGQAGGDDAGFGGDLALPAVQRIEVAVRKAAPVQMQV
ncbi:hypothetical protein G6F22_017419 [Rhizopus arrhizus]|nr:hypothetical protein G6F22_017419 [Rhizopus arrhizus]